MISGLALYPAGFLGTGLLLLRLSAAGSFIVLSGVFAGPADIPQFLSVLTAFGLCIGLQTRALAIITLAALIFWLLHGSAFSALSATHAADAIALFLTGPGAWSADAFLFGRRVVTFPGRDNTKV
jgi:hypothetical protein